MSKTKEISRNKSNRRAIVEIGAFSPARERYDFKTPVGIPRRFSRWEIPLWLTTFLVLVIHACLHPMPGPDQVPVLQAAHEMLTRSAYILPLLDGQPVLDIPAVAGWLLLPWLALLGAHSWIYVASAALGCLMQLCLLRLYITRLAGALAGRFAQLSLLLLWPWRAMMFDDLALSWGWAFVLSGACLLTFQNTSDEDTVTNSELKFTSRLLAGVFWGVALWLLEIDVLPILIILMLVYLEPGGRAPSQIAKAMAQFLFTCAGILLPLGIWALLLRSHGLLTATTIPAQLGLENSRILSNGPLFLHLGWWALWGFVLFGSVVRRRRKDLLRWVIPVAVCMLTLPADLRTGAVYWGGAGLFALGLMHLRHWLRAPRTLRMVYVTLVGLCWGVLILGNVRPLPVERDSVREVKDMLAWLALQQWEPTEPLGIASDRVPPMLLFYGEQYWRPMTLESAMNDQVRLVVSERPVEQLDLPGQWRKAAWFGDWRIFERQRPALPDLE